MKVLLTSLILTALFSQSVFATTTSSLRAITNNYKYAVEVEWDQQDPQFLDTKKLELEQGIAALIDAGASPKSLLQEALSEIPEGKQKKDIESLLNIVSTQKMSPEQFGAELLSVMGKQEGASWTGGANLLIGVGAAFAITYIVFRVYMNEWGKRL